MFGTRHRYPRIPPVHEGLSLWDIGSWRLRDLVIVQIGKFPALLIQQGHWNGEG